MTDSGPFITKTGKVLTDDDLEALVDEAECGYDVSKIMTVLRQDRLTPTAQIESSGGAS